ncbi:MAG: glycosyltransferase family 4 protein [Scytolyngbya sp. HA4215-MV1]|jgi:glycosyltransferase involved in cell wall biosynthesis|nr:glycosyltransferase family 4 protein [Scytolyngbya sp. HA4215-MV1]
MIASPRFAYISFDTVPMPKGAAVHIEAFARSLAAGLGPVHLVTVSPTAEVRSGWLAPGVMQTELPALGDTLLNRVLYFRQQLGQWFQGQRFEGVQFRSIYEGFPIAQQKSILCDRLIFEVNGMPSIELKYRYPAVADDRELLHKLTRQEQICLEAADRVITPSPVTGTYLQSRGVPVHKLRLIPNGVDLTVFSYQAPRMAPEFSPLRLLYFGTLAGWQGVGLAVEALGLYCRDFEATLTVIAPGRPAQVASLQKQAARLGVSDRLTLLPPLSQATLVEQMHQADAIVAPLTANDRNLVQGCCPLKVLEGMASGTPVIASDLPVVQALATNGEHALLVAPGSAKAMKDAMLQLRTDSKLRFALSGAARQRVEEEYTWERAGRSLVQVYEELGWGEARGGLV